MSSFAFNDLCLVHAPLFAREWGDALRGRLGELLQVWGAKLDVVADEGQFARNIAVYGTAMALKWAAGLRELLGEVDEGSATLKLDDARVFRLSCTIRGRRVVVRSMFTLESFPNGVISHRLTTAVAVDDCCLTPSEFEFWRRAFSEWRRRSCGPGGPDELRL